MPTTLITGLIGVIVVLALVLTTLLTAQLLLIRLIRLMRRNRRLRSRVFAVFGALTRPLAGRRLSPYALLRHTGRQSGRSYVTPLLAQRVDAGFVLTVTYGVEVDWCRNILASGRCALRWRGQEYALDQRELRPVSEAWDAYLLAERLIIAGAGVKHCLWLHQPSEAAHGDSADGGASVGLPAPRTHSSSQSSFAPRGPSVHARRRSGRRAATWTNGAHGAEARWARSNTPKARRVTRIMVDWRSVAVHDDMRGAGRRCRGLPCDALRVLRDRTPAP
jgi:deazaflavin-dependent oxidoreductase (nitroreductase family)